MEYPVLMVGEAGVPNYPAPDLCVPVGQVRARSWWPSHWRRTSVDWRKMSMESHEIPQEKTKGNASPGPISDKGALLADSPKSSRAEAPCHLSERMRELWCVSEYMPCAVHWLRSPRNVTMLQDPNDQPVLSSGVLLRFLVVAPSVE